MQKTNKNRLLIVGSYCTEQGQRILYKLLHKYQSLDAVNSDGHPNFYPLCRNFIKQLHSGDPNEPCIRRGSRSPYGKGQLYGGGSPL